MEHNKRTLELIHSQLENDALCHMTPEEKKAYNAQYYQRNKEKYWGVKGNRPMARPKLYGEDTIVEGKKPGVHRRGDGLGTGPVGSTGNRPSGSMATQNPSWLDQTKATLGKYADAAKQASKQAASDWKSGTKSISKMATESINRGKKLVSSILSKFK